MSEEKAKYEKIVELLMHENNTLKAALLESERCLDNGMTMRDQFAGLAMQGIIHGYGGSCDADAKVSYQLADAMLKARSEEETPYYGKLRTRVEKMEKGMNWGGGYE